MPADLMTDARSTARETWLRFLPQALQPLARRLTAVVLILLATVIGSMLWLAHRRVDSAVATAEGARLQASANQLAIMLQASARRLLQESARLATLPSLRAAASGSADRAAIVAAGKVLVVERAKSPQIQSIAVWDVNGKLIVADGSDAAARTNPPGRVKPLETVHATPIIGPLSAVAGTVTYSTTSPILTLDGQAAGSVVVTRRLASDGESASLLGGLVGRGARVMLGNADGKFWSDLTRPTAGPTLPPGPGTSGEYRDSAGAVRLAATASIADTPWLAMVEIPRVAAVAASSQFAVETAAIGSAFILVGALLSWWFIRRAMNPLHDVTRAAESMAGGDYSQRVDASGFDEIAALGRTFNTMAEKVSRSAGEIASRANALQAANAELHESEQRYRALFEHLPDGIVVHRDCTILFANPTSLRILGVTAPLEIVGTWILGYVAAADRELLECRINEVVDGSLALAVEVRIDRPDRKAVIVEATSVGLMVDGAPAVQTIMHDVSEQRLLEEEFRQSQKMDAVGRLAGGVAHDFNNLLTVIQAHSEFALGNGATEASRREDIEQIRRAADSAARLTRQLLTFSRKQVLSPAHLDLNDAIAGMLGMVRRLIGDNIEVRTALANEVDGIWADPGQLQQVLLNLAVNARDAMPNGGTLRFETANISIGEGYLGVSASVIPPGPYVMLAVQDTGVGMTEEVRTRVFEPFFSTKQPGKGTGLGLSTVYGIVHQSQGHIWVYSEPGLGTTFKVFFPPHRGALSRQDDAEANGQELAIVQAHLMVVEDEPDVRSAICRALRQSGFTVTEGTHAGDAIAILARDRSIDLMITDMVMPGQSGISLVADVRATHPALPVIILSGYSEETTSQEWRVPEHAVFVEKPVSPADLIRHVRRLLASR